MNGQEIIARLRENEAALRSRGVRHAALFVSRARGENRPGSDTDIMIDLDPEAPIGVWGYVGLKDYIAGLFDGPVDVVNRESLKPYMANDIHPQVTRRRMGERGDTHRLTRQHASKRRP